MPPQQSGRIHKYLTSTRAPLRDDESLDRIVLYGPDGEPIDLSTIGEAPEIPEPDYSLAGGFKGLWQPDTDYPAGSIVGLDASDGNPSDVGRVWAFGTDVDMPAGTAIPGVNPNEMVLADGPGGPASTGEYQRIAPGVNDDIPYVDGHARVFFDLITGGTIVIAYAVAAGHQFGELIDETGTSKGQAPGLGQPLTINDLDPGRYYGDIQEAFGGDGAADMTLTLSNGATVPDAAIFWYSFG